MDLRGLFLNDRVAAALVTALVGGGVVAAGWFWTHALSRRRDRQLREERVGDIQRALLAEFGERWQRGLDSLLGGQHDIADRLDACVAAYASTDRAATSAYVAAMTGSS